MNNSNKSTDKSFFGMIERVGNRLPHPVVLFIESNVDRRPMETISSETGVAIYEQSVLSDEIGKPGEAGDSYIEYLEYNLDVILDGLAE